MVSIIEFNGPPGVGKTLLARIAVDYLKQNDVKTFDRKDVQYLGLKRWYERKRRLSTEERMLKFFLDHIPQYIGKNLIEKSPILIDRYEYKQEMLGLFEIQNKDLVDSLIDCLKDLYESDYLVKIISRRINQSFTRYQSSIYNFNDEIVVLDEGAIHQFVIAFSLINSDKLPEDWEQSVIDLAKLLSKKIDYSFFITADAETCFKRQSKRKRIVRGVKDETDKKMILKDLEHRSKTYQLIHETLLENGVKSFMIDNNGSLEDAKEQLYPSLDEIIREVKE